MFPLRNAPTFLGPKHLELVRVRFHIPKRAFYSSLAVAGTRYLRIRIIRTSTAVVVPAATRTAGVLYVIGVGYSSTAVL